MKTVYVAVSSVLLAAVVLGAVLLCKESGGLVITPETAEIVVAAEAPKIAAFAAEEMARVLERSLGRRLPVVSAPTPGRLGIVLGDSPWTREAGIDAKTLSRDVFRIRTDSEKGRIYIVGRDDPKQDIAAALAAGGKMKLPFERATLFGAYEFLERFAGARFYFPTELGTCIPERRRIVVPDTDFTGAPAFIARHYYVNGDGAWPKELDADYGGRLSGKNLCWMRLRMQTKRITPCHGQNDYRYTERFRDSHPEYLQLRKNGKRATESRPPSDKRVWYYGHWCHTSAIWDVFYEDIVKRIRAGEKYIDVTPQDGLQRCWCENCQKAYSKEHPSTWSSELLWGNVAKLAKRLIAEKIDAYILMSAYGSFSRIPDIDIPTNVLVSCSERGPWMKAVPEIRDKDDAHYRAWHRKTGSKNMFWTYPCKWSGFNIPDIPQSTPRAVAEYFLPIVPISTGGFYESGSDRALYNYLNYYIFSKVSWDGKLDVDAVLEEHHRLMFGAAAKPMGEFFDSVEERWIYGVAGRSGAIGMNSLGPVFLGPSKLELWTRIYPPELIERWRDCFERAAKAVASGSLEARRIAFLRGIFLDPTLKASRAYMKTVDVKRAVEERSAAGGVVNLMENGGFSSSEGWKLSSPGGLAEIDDAEGVIKPGALHIVSENHSPTGQYLRAYATTYFTGEKKLKPGSTYRLSFFMKTKNVRAYGHACGADVVVHYAGKDHSHSSPAVCGTQDWAHQECTFTVPADAKSDARYSVRARLICSSGEAWFDDFQLTELPATKGEGK